MKTKKTKAETSAGTKKTRVTPPVTLEQVRGTVLAANIESLDKFRAVLGERHELLDAFLESPSYHVVPFLEREFIRIQRDAIRAALVAANLQAEVIQHTPA